MKINPHLIKHIDSKSIDLVDWLQAFVLKRKANPEPPEQVDSSMKHKPSTDISEYIVESEGSISHNTNFKGDTIEKWYTKDDKRLGYDEEKYKLFVKFVRSIHVHPDIEKLTSFIFLSEIVFNWAIKTKEVGRASNNLSDEIIFRISDSTVKRTYCFPILNLEIQEPFEIGPVKIKFFRNEDFDYLSNNFEPKHENHENPFPAIKEIFNGMVVASSNEIGEPKQSENIALSKCLIAIDILKICSDTIELPESELGFDIDMRARYQSFSQIISHNCNTLESIEVTKYRLPNNHYIDKNYLTRMRRRLMDEISNYVFQSQEPNELHELVVNAISNFGEALTTGDLHKRIVEIFSIFESLLIPSDSHPIQESLYKYGTHLIFKKLEDRRGLKKLFTEMYKVRSAMIHHGKRKPLEIEKLRKLQLSLLMLIIEISNNNENHLTKASLLSEIDDKLDSV